MEPQGVWELCNCGTHFIISVIHFFFSPFCVTFLPLLCSSLTLSSLLSHIPFFLHIFPKPSRLLSPSQSPLIPLPAHCHPQTPARFLDTPSWEGDRAEGEVVRNWMKNGITYIRWWKGSNWEWVMSHGKWERKLGTEKRPTERKNDKRVVAEWVGKRRWEITATEGVDRCVLHHKVRRQEHLKSHTFDTGSALMAWVAEMIKLWK